MRSSSAALMRDCDPRTSDERLLILGSRFRVAHEVTDPNICAYLDYITIVIQNYLIYLFCRKLALREQAQDIEEPWVADSRRPGCCLKLR